MAEAADNEIWKRVIDPSWAQLHPEAARSILRLKLPKADVTRINKLSALARKGRLTESQKQELDLYLAVGGMLTVMHSKARRALKEAPASPRRRRAS